MIINKINETYEKLKQLPKPKTEMIGGTYYGSTQLYSRVGNDLELMKYVPYIKYCYGGNIHYKEFYGIKIGGAYKTDLDSELYRWLKENVHDKNWTVIHDRGTNYSVVGIGHR